MKSLPRDEELALAKAMEPARIALQRRKSSDSIDSFGVGPETRVVRKGKRRGTKKFTKTKVQNIKGDDLRSPFPISEGVRHSDRAPEKRVRVLRDDINANGIGRKKRLHRGDRARRQTRSLSPQTLDRQKSANDLLSWKPMELLNVAEHAGISHKIRKEEDESSLGSLIEAIEVDFGGQQHDMSNYHQSAPCLSSVRLFSEDDPEDESSFRFSPDADAILSVTSGNGGKDAPSTSISSRKAPIGDTNNGSTGTLATENSTLSTSFEEAVMDLFTGLKPQTDPPSTLNPPSMHDRKDPAKIAKKNVDSLKKKRNTRPKETVSVTSDDSQWLELVLPLNEKNATGEQSTGGQSTVGQSTVGDVKAYKTDSNGTINSMNSEEVKEKMKDGLLGKSLSALDVQDLLSPSGKKDFLRATTHCSPTQVSKHTGLSSLSAHTGTNSSNRSNSSAYLLERLPLKPPMACDEGESSSKKSKKAPAPKRKSKKGSDVSVDESVEVFQDATVKSKEEEESAATTVQKFVDIPKDAASGTVRAPRRGRRPVKNDADGLSNTLAQISPRLAGQDPQKKTSKSSDATLESVEIFNPTEGMKCASDEVSTACDELSTDDTGPVPSSDVTTAGTAFVPTRTDSRKIQPSKTSYLVTTGSAYSEGTSQISSPSQRKNPPARPWSGRSSFADDSLVSSIKELSEGPLEEESMLNVLITSLKKDQPDVLEHSGFEHYSDDQNEPENVVVSKNDNTTKRPLFEEEPKTPKKIKKMDAVNQTKSPKTGKKQSQKMNSRSLTSTSSASPGNDNTQIESSADNEHEGVDPSAISPSPPKSPQSHQKTRKSNPNSLDVSAISAPPFTTPRRKKEVNTSKADISVVVEETIIAENVIPRRRLRSRKTGDETTRTVLKGKKSPARVRPGIGNANCKSTTKKTPTRVRPSTDGEAIPDESNAKRKTPTRLHPGTDGTTVVRKKTPTRIRNPTEEANAPEANRTPTRVRPTLTQGGKTDTNVVRKKTPTRVRQPAEEINTSEMNRTPTRVRPKMKEVVGVSAGNRTPTRTRGEGGNALVGNRTPNRARPVVEDGITPVRRKTPTRLRSRLDNEGASQWKKTPTRVRKGVDVSGQASSCANSGLEPPGENDQRQNTPTKLRSPGQPELQSLTENPVRINGLPTEIGQTYTSPNSDPDKERSAPDPPAATHGLALDSEGFDPPATTRDVGDTNRQSTPTRVRKMFDAAAERVVSACRTPPRERLKATQSPGRGGKSMRDRSFSPFSRLRMLGSRTPPRQRLIDESDGREGSRPPSRRVSQSPTQERPAPSESETLSPIPVLDSLSSPSERPLSRGRRRSSGSASRKSEDTSDTAVSQNRQNSIGSQNSLASKSRSTIIPKRKMGIDQSVGSFESDEKPGRTKTPTRGLRAKNGNPVEVEDPKKVSIRPRRRGGSASVDRESSSGTTLSEKPSSALLNTDNARRKVRRRTPTRDRQPVTDPLQTPTKSQKKRPAVVRGSSERQFGAPDPPGVNNSKIRTPSSSRPGRSKSQPRPRNGEHPMVPVSSQSLHVDGGPSLADFFD